MGINGQIFDDIFQGDSVSTHCLIDVRCCCCCCCVPGPRVVYEDRSSTSPDCTGTVCTSSRGKGRRREEKKEKRRIQHCGVGSRSRIDTLSIQLETVSLSTQLAARVHHTGMYVGNCCRRAPCGTWRKSAFDHGKDAIELRLYAHYVKLECATQQHQVKARTVDVSGGCMRQVAIGPWHSRSM